MIIDDCLSFFHDGAVFDINHYKDSIVISMRSAEIDVEDIDNKFSLSRENRINGKLPLEGIQKVEVNEIPFRGKLTQLHDFGGIIDLAINHNQVFLCIDWENFPPKLKMSECSTILVQAKNIWWENIPELQDPFW